MMFVRVHTCETICVIDVSHWRDTDDQPVTDPASMAFVKELFIYFL